MYVNEWEGFGVDDLGNVFNLSKDEIIGMDILLASLAWDGHSECSFVLFKRDGKLFRVEVCCCTCHGCGGTFYGQWDPEETTIDELWHDLKHGNLREGRFVKELSQILSSLSDSDK